jgi:hypothetical protein
LERAGSRRTISPSDSEAFRIPELNFLELRHGEETSPTTTQRMGEARTGRTLCEVKSAKE